MNWPLKRIIEYSTFLKKWYKKKYGDPEEMDDFDMPGSMSSVNSKMPSMSKSRLKGKMTGQSMRRGAKGHKYKFK